ncbi:hypothetical protein [Mesorhizobium sp. M1252]|uniref:hypothetical protein n=1 Tax=Mesorhizobium sp. M1252 TaxID=2957073 RepID=UPI003338EFEF
MTTRDFFCLAVYGYKKCCPVHLDAYTKADAERAMRWQQVGPGQFDTYHVVQPHRTKRGTFVSVTTGAEFEASKMGFTDEAWTDFLSRVWGA